MWQLVGRRRVALAVGTVLAVLSMRTAVADEPQSTKIAVFDIHAKTGIEQGTVDVFADLLQARIHSELGYEVIGSEDIQALLGMEQLKQAMACEDSSCLAQIGGALGVDGMVTGSLARLGQYLVISLKYIDPAHARVLAQSTRQLEDASEGALVESVGPMVRELFASELAPDAAAGGPSAPSASSHHSLRFGLSGGFAVETVHRQGLLVGAWLEPVDPLQLEAMWEGNNQYFWLIARVALLDFDALRLGPSASVQFDTEDFKGIGLGLFADAGTWLGPIRLGARFDASVLRNEWTDSIVFPVTVQATVGMGL